jgi:hypothetical protein
VNTLIDIWVKLKSRFTQLCPCCSPSRSSLGLRARASCCGTHLPIGPFATQTLRVLNELLIVLMLVEILHTVRISIRSHVLVTEPFLVVGLIASIRRVLVISLEMATLSKEGSWPQQGNNINCDPHRGRSVHPRNYSGCRPGSHRSGVKDETKTHEDDEGVVPIIEPLRLLLDAVKPGNASGWMFPNTIGGALDLDNLADRVIKPVFKANGMKWKGWHAYRRGLATNLHELGVPDKVIQAILRHEDVSTTQRSYIKTVPQVVTDAMKQLEARIARAAVVQQVSVN